MNDFEQSKDEWIVVQTSDMERQLEKQYKAGWFDGWNDGYEAGWRNGRQKLADEILNENKSVGGHK